MAQEELVVQEVQEFQAGQEGQVVQGREVGEAGEAKEAQELGKADIVVPAGVVSPLRSSGILQHPI